MAVTAQAQQSHQQQGQHGFQKGGHSKGVNFNKFNNSNSHGGYGAGYSNGGHWQGHNNHGYGAYNGNNHSGANAHHGHGSSHNQQEQQQQGYGQGHGASNRSYERRRDARLTADELSLLTDEQFVEIAKDKWKSRSLQRSLMESDQEVVRLIHQKAEPIFDQLLSDQYGNYLSQKILEFCTNSQYDDLFNKVAHRLHLLANEVSTLAFGLPFLVISYPLSIDRHRLQQDILPLALCRKLDERSYALSRDSLLSTTFTKQYVEN